NSVLSDMSVSSGSSLCGDHDQDLLLDEEEDIDFYAILNVPKDVSNRILCLLADRFLALLDPKKRAIYDALGVQGLDTQGWELVSRSANPENIRREYDFLQRLKEQELMLQRIHPASGFVVKTSCAGLFPEDPDDRYPPQLIGIAITQSVDCAMTDADRIGLIGRVKAGNGRGDGSVSVLWKKNAGKFHVENTFTASSDVLNLSCRLSRPLYTRAAIIIQPSIQYFPMQETFAPALSLIYSMRLRVRWQGSIILNLTPAGSALTTTLVHTENNQPKAVINFTLSPTNSNVRLVYFVRNPERDAFTESALQLSMFGVTPSIHFERRLSRFSRIGCALHFSFPSCMLSARFKLKTGQSSFEWHVVLCDDREALARSTIYGVVVPVVLFHLATKVVFRRWYDRFTSLFDDHSHDREVDTVKQEEAGR
ncbi:DnaJ subfamily C member 11, partial [Trichostrongylus colubriformis]